jgi:hypothetical protein
MKKIMLLTTALSLLFATTVFSGDMARKARVVDIEGQVMVKEGGGVFAPAELGTELSQGDLIKTGAGASALLFIDGIETAQVQVYENSQLLMGELLIDRKAKSQSTLLDLAVGKLLVKSKKIHNKSSVFEVKTPTTVVGVMGDMDSTFSVEVEVLE